MLILQKEPRSPLRYAGGKSRGVVEILNFVPQKTKEIYSPFFGGGSVEIACANNGIKVHGFDSFKPLVDFWQCLLSNPKKLVERVNEHYPLARSTFYNLQKTYNKYNKYERAAIFYVLNRASFSGTTLSGGMSPGHPRFTTSSIDRLANFRIDNLDVHHANFDESIKKSGKKLLYLDPPYMIDQRLYGNKGNLHNGFDHVGLAKILKKRTNWILSYNDSEKVADLYSGYDCYYPKWKYGMSNNKNSSEVLITSHDIQER